MVESGKKTVPLRLPALLVLPLERISQYRKLLDVILIESLFQSCSHSPQEILFYTKKEHLDHDKLTLSRSELTTIVDVVQKKG